MLPPIISKKLYQLGTKSRNPSLFRIYDSLKESEALSKEKLRSVQFERTAQLLSFAQRYSPYYARIFKQHGFDSKTYSGLEDLNKIPITDKATLLENCQLVHANHKFPASFEAETSGTTGNALKFQKSEEWDSTNRAALMRSYDWYDVKPWEYNGYLWGFNISGNEAAKVKALDYVQNRFRLFSYRRDEIYKFARKLRSATFLTGYSSMIYEIAKLINEENLFSPSDFDQLKLIKGTSETILDIYKAEVEKAFGLNLTSEYGAAEAGLIAFECPQGRLHINVENVILETNENNEAIVTNLVSHSFPIIRYNLGDVIELADDNELCGCGRAHSLLKSLSGRKGASVYGKSNQYPALTFYYVFKNLALQKKLFLNYRAFQNEAGAVDLKIEQTSTNYSEALLKDQLQTYFGNDLHVEIEWGFNLELARAGKVQYFNTTLG